MANKEVTVDFWNVGQGDCSTIRTADNHLVVLDVGPRNSPLVTWLIDNPELIIDDIILTHNDADHAGAIVPIVGQLGITNRIKTIYMLRDRVTNDSVFNRLFRCVKEGSDAGHFNVFGLEVKKDPECLWTDVQSGLELVLHFPSFIQNIDSKNPNTSSAILTLQLNKQAIVVWPGDNLLKTTCEVVSCNSPAVLMGPHHGAPQDHPLDPNYICQIAPVSGYLSLGTSNNYGHPKPAYIKQLAKNGIYVGCSQLTKQCDNDLNHDRPVLQTSALLGLQPTASGIPCRDALRIIIQDGTVRTDEWVSEHCSRLIKLKRPMCIKSQKQ